MDLAVRTQRARELDRLLGIENLIRRRLVGPALPRIDQATASLSILLIVALDLLVEMRLQLLQRPRLVLLGDPEEQRPPLNRGAGIGLAERAARLPIPLPGLRHQS